MRLRLLTLAQHLLVAPPTLCRPQLQSPGDHLQAQGPYIQAQGSRTAYFADDWLTNPPNPTSPLHPVGENGEYESAGSVQVAKGRGGSLMTVVGAVGVGVLEMEWIW